MCIKISASVCTSLKCNSYTYYQWKFCNFSILVKKKTKNYWSLTWTWIFLKHLSLFLNIRECVCANGTYYSTSQWPLVISYELRSSWSVFSLTLDLRGKFLRQSATFTIYQILPHTIYTLYFIVINLNSNTLLWFITVLNLRVYAQ